MSCSTPRREETSWPRVRRGRRCVPVCVVTTYPLSLSAFAFDGFTALPGRNSQFRFVFSGGDDCTLRVWDCRSNSKSPASEARLSGENSKSHFAGVTALAFAPRDPSLLLTGRQGRSAEPSRPPFSRRLRRPSQTFFGAAAVSGRAATTAVSEPSISDD